MLHVVKLIGARCSDVTLPLAQNIISRHGDTYFLACTQDSLPEWSKGVDSSSTSASCVGSNPTAVNCFHVYSILGTEPRTSRTQSENHATRPNSQMLLLHQAMCPWIWQLLLLHQAMWFWMVSNLAPNFNLRTIQTLFKKR